MDYRKFYTENRPRIYLIATIGLIGAAVFVFISLADNHAPLNSEKTGIIAIDAGASVQKPGSPLIATNPAGLSSPDKALPDGQTVARQLARSLPALQEVAAECSGTSCTVSAKAVGSQVEGDQHVLEQIVTNDIPTALSGLGYTLIEPLQIEETGPGESRVRFRVAVGSASL